MEMLSKGIFPQSIDNTMRSDFVSCPTKFYWSFPRQLGPAHGSVDLVAGASFARGLEVTRLHYYGDKWPLEKALEKGMLEAIAAYTMETPEGKEKKGVDRVIAALADYFSHYNPATDHIQPHFNAKGLPMVEFSFAVPLPIDNPDTGQPILYSGRFDMVGVYNGQLFGVDEKTASQLGATWGRQWNLRSQFTGYTWALHNYNLPVAGMIVRGVSFLTRGFGHEENIQLRPKWMIDAWYEQLLRDITRMVETYKTGWYDQSLGEACAAYSGCPFQRLCTTPNPENWIEGHYIPRIWDPLAKLPYAQPKQEVEQINDPDLAAFMKEESQHA